METFAQRLAGTKLPAHGTRLLQLPQEVTALEGGRVFYGDVRSVPRFF